MFIVILMVLILMLVKLMKYLWKNYIFVVFLKLVKILFLLVGLVWEKFILWVWLEFGLLNIMMFVFVIFWWLSLWIYLNRRSSKVVLVNWCFGCYIWIWLFWMSWDIYYLVKLEVFCFFILLVNFMSEWVWWL